MSHTLFRFGVSSAAVLGDDGMVDEQEGTGSRWGSAARRRSQAERDGRGRADRTYPSADLTIAGDVSNERHGRSDVEAARQAFEPQTHGRVPRLCAGSGAEPVQLRADACGGEASSARHSDSGSSRTAAKRAVSSGRSAFSRLDNGELGSANSFRSTARCTLPPVDRRRCHRTDLAPALRRRGRSGRMFEAAAAP